MSTMQDIKSAIETLSPAERQSLTTWLHELQDSDVRVAEAAPAYRVTPESHHMSVEEYLRFEESSPVKHEYVAGEIYAMSGVSRRHNLIAGNVFGALFNYLRGGPCKAFIADFKVHLRSNRDEFFYYPDVMVACGEGRMDAHYLDDPKLIVEVLSPSTERIDRGEKAGNYRKIPTLEEYVLIAQDRLQVTIQRRAENWAPLVLTSSEDIAAFRSIELSLPLTQIYEDVLSSGVVVATTSPS